jgi:hypothetical protein
MLLVSTFGVAQDVTQLWMPEPVPLACGQFHTELLLLDVSKSMRQKGLFDSVKDKLARSVDDTPDCNLLIIGTFGLTADIKGAQFLQDAAARARLRDVVASLTATDSQTNLDEAAKLIEWIDFKIQVAYHGDGLPLYVKVLSDHISSPSTGKPLFSLRKYLENHLSAGQLVVEEIGVLPSVTADLPLPSGDGASQISVDRLSETLLPHPAAHSPDASASDVKPRPPARGSWPYLWARSAFMLTTPGLRLVNAIVLVTVTAGLIAIFLIRRKKKPLDPDSAVPTALIIAETLFPRNDSDGARVIQEKRIPVAIRVPVVIGTDPSRSTFVVEQAGEDGQKDIFRLVPLPGSQLQVFGGEGGVVNGEPIPKNGVLVSLTTPLTLQSGSHRWMVRGVFGAVNRSQADELFRTSRKLNAN